LHESSVKRSYGLASMMMFGYNARTTGELGTFMSENLLRDELAAALKAATEQDEQRTIAIIRLIQAALKERDDQRREDTGQHRIADDEIVSMLTAMVEQRQESMRRYEETGQLEIAEREAEEIDILRQFLPSQLDDETRELAVDQVIAELGASKLKDIGRVMNELKRRYPGQMNFSAVRRRLCDQLG
jgi:uncharacterized protein YqeY